MPKTKKGGIKSLIVQNVVVTSKIGIYRTSDCQFTVPKVGV